MRILQLTAENIKRLKIVHIEPDGSLVQITGKNGQGKQQPVSEPVLTPTGWKAIGAVRVGDFVVGSDGKPTQVLGVFPQTVRDTYLVTMADGASTRCGPDHLWTVSRWNERGGSKDRVTETLSLAQIVEIGLRRGASRRWAVPIVAPIEFEPQGFTLPIDPYTLGIILGDGHIEPTGYTTITSWDEEVLDAVAPVEFWRDEHAIGTGAWSRPLLHLGLAGKRSWEKFIPEIYFGASIEDRQALLAGLMDSDGTAPESWAQFSSTSEHLIDGVIRLAASLGCVAKKTGGATKKYTYNGERREGRIAWSVSIKSNAAPFTLVRKIAAWSKSEQRGERWRFIDTVERVDDEDSVCIRVAAEDGLYVTKDFILTHNTSVLDSIWWALAGGHAIQKTPIRRGAESATITLNLGGDAGTKLIVERRFTPDHSYLKVKTPEGASFDSPQKMLDAMLGGLSFDPLEFVREDERGQFDILKRLVPLAIDIDALDRERTELFRLRTIQNKQAKAVEARALAMTVDPTAPAARIDVNAIVDELAGVDRWNARRREIIDIAKQAESAAQAAAREVKDLTARLKAARESYADLNEDFQMKRLAADVAQSEFRDAVEITDRLRAAEAANAAFENNARRRALELEAQSERAESDRLTARMESIDAEKAAAIGAAKMPIAGLSFGDGEVLFDGLPLSQASDAQQLLISTSIAAALNPQLRVLRIRDGSLLDEDSLKLLASFAEERDFQIWIERVDSSGEVGIVMEDGCVRADGSAAA